MQRPSLTQGGGGGASRVHGGARRLTASGRAVGLVWLFSRALVFATLVWTCHTRHHSLKWALESWDVGHFIRISQQAYRMRVEVAFFPGLPALMHVGHAVGIPPWVLGTTLSLVCSALAAWAMFRLGGGLAACCWLLAPMTVFTVVAYTEAPFAACAFWAWERARAGRWWQAALLAALGSTLRISGLFLAGALVIMALLQPGRRLPRLVALVIPIAVTVAYFTYLHHLTGDWSAWSHAQAQGWHRKAGITSPLVSFHRTLVAAQAGHWGPLAPHKHWVFRSEIASVAVGLVTIAYSLARRWWAAAAYVAVQVVAFTTSVWWLSVCRGVLLWFPLFLMLGTTISWRPRNPVARGVWMLFWAVVAATTCVVIVLWSWLFFTRQWAG